ncbi:cuticle protein 10.9-like [Tropilaelaps mercedesae]|uniref:Cuticle protein 10.9-like n=1 Tax=Tropilaelaps mercedesae TaxID=418985 RepID=A0A1V9X0L3_9ACAR|nr:cuticle protein 10.9-like [Tropilaelaps mercedesae]
MQSVLIVLLCLVAMAASQKESYPPQPFKFTYSAEDPEGSHTHSQQGDGTGKVTGEYTITLADGRSRTVKYTADKNGYQAEIITNELGTESKNPADVTIQSTAPTGAAAALQRPSTSAAKASASYTVPVYVPYAYAANHY